MLWMIGLGFSGAALTRGFRFCWWCLQRTTRCKGTWTWLLTSQRPNCKVNSPISLWGEDIETVAEEFCYLGSVMSRVGEADKNISVRISKTSFSFRYLQPVWRSRQLSLNTMLRIFFTNVKSVLLYGCEIWRSIKAPHYTRHVFVNKCGTDPSRQ